MVAGTLSRLRRVLEANEAPVSPAGFLRPINTQLIAEQFELERQGKERGAKNQPHPDDEVYDAVEQKVVHAVQSEWSMQGGELVNNLRA